MKRLLTFLAFALAAASSFGATLTPIQLLSPAGSTAGQAIVSTGSSTAPAWAPVTATALTAQAANTVVANVTAASASPTAVAMPSCSTANSALKYTTSTGFSCGTTYALTSGTLAQFAATTSAQLAGVVSDETGSGALVFGTSPTLTTPVISTPTIANGTMSGTAITNSPISGNGGSFTTLSATALITPSSTVGIKGTVTNDSAQAGSIGEYLTNSTATTSATSGTTLNATSVALTAGDWDVQCSAQFNPAASTVLSTVFTSVNTVSATNGSLGTATQIVNSGFVNGQIQIIESPVVRISLASSGTVYCPSYAGFTTSTLTISGFVRARRVR